VEHAFEHETCADNFNQKIVRKEAILVIWHRR
jgi:hypothetical protein